jgi:hypothetical protein
MVLMIPARIRVEPVRTADEAGDDIGDCVR